MRSQGEKGQILPLMSVLFLFITIFGLLLVIGVGSLYVDTTLGRQALISAARDGTTALDFGEESLNLNEVGVDKDDELAIHPISKHCLDIGEAKARARSSLERNISRFESQFRTAQGEALSAQSIAQDEGGVYLVIAAGNPPALSCNDTGDPHPQGGVFNRPWVYLKTSIHVQVRGGGPVVLWIDETTATSAIDVQGGGT